MHNFKFSAFLSYAHADARWGTWLHKRLEGYKLDRELVGRVTPRGPVPKTLRPIFRDRDDFSGGHTLTDAPLRRSMPTPAGSAMSRVVQ